MLQANTTTFPSGSPLNVLDAPSSRHRPTVEHVPVRRERQSELAIDDALAGSFPASDPPAWNPGMARPIPVETSRGRANDIRLAAARDETVPGTPGTIALSRPYRSERTVLQVLISLVGAAGIALLLPFPILLVGLPIALGVRGLLEAFAWLFAAIR